MIQTASAVRSFLWNPSQWGVQKGAMEFKRPQLSTISSHTLWLKLQNAESTSSRTILCASKRLRQDMSFKKQKAYPQNVDLPPLLPKKKKKPYPIPIEKIRQVAKKDKKLAEMGIEKPLEPPKNGILVPNLIPVAFEVIDAWKLLIKGLAQLSHVISVYVSARKFMWLIVVTIFKTAKVQLLLSVKAFTHGISAVVELCIQAGVDIPEYPSRRRTRPIRMLGRKIIDRGGLVEEPRPWHSRGSSALFDLDTDGACGRFPPPSLTDVPRIAQETMDAYEIVRSGVTKLMRNYSVKACGYCSEVHVGPWGHNVKLCGAFKHQWRDGKHGWQDAVVDEVFPPNYVWHVQDPKGPPMRSALKRYYGKAPAVVEVCKQAGALIPEQYKPMMRLDIIVPESEEVDLVA